MGVVDRWASGKEGELPTLLDFSTTSSCNSVPMQPVSLMHCKRQSPTRSHPADWLHSALIFRGQYGAGVVIGGANLQCK